MLIRTTKFVFATVFTILLLVTSAGAQSLIPGNWPCKDGPGNGIPQKMPPKKAIIYSKVMYMAPQGSEWQFALAKGGPTGMYIFSHLHGIHNDRAGYTTYDATVFVTDQSGYYYGMLPELHAKVTGHFRRPQTHQHCGAQFTVPSEIVHQLNAALKNGGSIKLEVSAGRDRTDVLKQVEQDMGDKVSKYVEQYLSKKISIETLFSLLNAGKTPFGK